MLKTWLSWLCLFSLAWAGDGPALTHRLEKGQTLAAVARIYGLPLAELLQANPELEPSKLRVGQPVLVPAPASGWSQWTVMAGQTASQQGYPLAVLEQLNPGVDLNHLKVGQQVFVPNAPPVALAPATPQAEVPLSSESPPPPVPPKGDWELITLADGRKGWAPRQALLIPSQRPLSPTELLELASRFQGAPYAWGGASPNGVDCSGFVQEVFRLAGHSLPRLADAQFEQTHPVDSPQPGDLVFFTTYEPGPSHVGISLGGQEFLHASSSRGVIRASLEENYFKTRYLGARRLPAWSEPHARVP